MNLSENKLDNDQSTKSDLNLAILGTYENFFHLNFGIMISENNPFSPNSLNSEITSDMSYDS